MSKRAGWFPHDPKNDPSANHPAGADRSSRVVGIGALCDFATGAPESGPSQSFSIEEFVELEDGRRVIVDHRGWTESSVRKLVELEDGRRVVVENVASARIGLTPENVRETVLNVVLPDDDEEALKEPHPWSSLAESARRQGIRVTADELKALQYEVVFTDRLAQWLKTP